MAVVKETIGHYVYMKGGPIYETETVYYVYCDNCGSFRIQTHLGGIHWLGLFIFLSLSAFLYNQLILKYSIPGWGCWMPYVLVFVFSFKFLSKYFPHKCIKCGNTDISSRDVMNFYDIENIHQLIDVPKSGLHKHDERNMKLLKDLKSLVLVVPLIIFSQLIILIAIMYFSIREAFFDKQLILLLMTEKTRLAKIFCGQLRGFLELVWRNQHGKLHMREYLARVGG